MARRKNKQQIFEKVEILDAGARGKSVAKAPDGRSLFLNNVGPGDVVDVRTGKKRTTYDEGTAIHVHQYSEKRVEPVCAHFLYCGGCKWQNMNYAHQLKYKQKEVTNNLQRIGQIKVEEILPIVACEKHYFYRNKMEFSFSSNRWLTPEEIVAKEPVLDRNACGFHIAGMWDKILDIVTCHLLEDPSNDIRNFINQFGNEHDLEFFDPRGETGIL